MFTMDPSRQVVGYLVRHGELTNMSVWDAWTDMDLSEKGKESAEKAAQWLSFERIGRVIASDLPRSVHTAEYLMETGAVCCPFLGTDPNLRPWMVGIFTGKEKTAARIADFQKYVDDPSLAIPDGESHNQLDERIQVIYSYLASPYNALPTAFFVHNSVIKSLMGIANVKDACSPGGIVAVYMNEKSEFEFEIVLGHVEIEKGVS